GPIMTTTTDWALVLTDQYGAPYRVFDEFTAFDLALVVNGVGAWVVNLPIEQLDWRWLRPDTRLLIYHRQRLLVVGLLRRWNIARRGGVVTVQLAGVDQNSLLERRIVA